jgi:CO/xanthine dehydrogenase FAD-binding subunit
MIIEKYAKPRSVEEAWALLNGNEKAAIVGGGAWLRLSGRKLELAVDLFETGLDYIRRTGDRLEIGAMATYRQVETDPHILATSDGLIAKSVRDIVGVQMRNIFTVGGTVVGRYGFSHLNCALLALGADVEFHNGGRLSFADYLDGEGPRRDILTRVVVDGSQARGSFQAVQRYRNDFALLAVAAVRRDDGIRLAVGARPGRARLAEAAMAHLADSPSDGDWNAVAVRAGELATMELNFGDDHRASAEYRRIVCPILVERALKEVLS